MDKRDFLKRSILGGLVTATLPIASCAPARFSSNQPSPVSGNHPPPADARGHGFPTVGTIHHATFLAPELPQGWITEGGFVPGLQGLQSPGSGGWGVYAYWDKLIALDEDLVTCLVRVREPASVFAIARLSNQKKGTVAEVDFGAGLLKLYAELPKMGAEPVGVVAQTQIEFTAVADREYRLVLQKISERYVVRLTDTVTHQTAEIDYLDTGQTPSSGKAWNAPGFVFRAGNVALLSYTYSSHLPHSPRVLVVGDSIADGDTIRLAPCGGYPNRWAGLLSAALGQNVSIVARGGETSPDVQAKLPLLARLFRHPQYVLYAIGTNDTSFPTWRQNYLSFKSAFEAKGAEVIPATLFPRSGREAFCAQVTDYILQNGDRYADFARALTQSGERQAREETLFLPDKLHPNPEGHRRMFDQLRVDLPDIFV